MVINQPAKIVRVFPILKSSGNPSEDSEFYKQKCTLHIPFRGSVDNLLRNSTCRSWYELYHSIFPEEMNPISAPCAPSPSCSASATVRSRGRSSASCSAPARSSWRAAARARSRPNCWSAARYSPATPIRSIPS